MSVCSSNYGSVNSSVRVCSYNCRGVKNSVDEIRELCQYSDFIFIQEHWLLPFDLGILNNIHNSFLSTGQSAVDISTKVLVGRPYGGTAILYNAAFAGSVTVVDTFDSRLTAVKFNSNLGPILLVCVYLPCDTGDQDCLEAYIDTCCKINSIFDDTDVVHAIIAGDFNCQVGTRFHDVFSQCVETSKLVITDMKRLSNVCTYYSDDGSRSSWIDHVLCSPVVDRLVQSIDILPQFISSDHKPLLITFDGITTEVSNTNSTLDNTGSRIMPNWSKADNASLILYDHVLSDALSRVNIPVSLLREDTIDPNDATSTLAIDDYYNKIVTCIEKATQLCIPHTLHGSDYNDCFVAGWNDVVKDKHCAARAAYLDWVTAGKPRQGPLFTFMARTRASFKYALRYCRHHEDMLRADICAKNLSNREYRAFWKNINNCNNNAATKHASEVNGCSGESNIADMWRNHFEKLYNSVRDEKSKALFYEQLAKNTDNINQFVIRMSELSDCINKQKRGKAVGLDGIASEAYIHGGTKLHVHLCVLFNLFLKATYIPSFMMQAMIIPLVKCKTGCLSDVNNYRAIAISTALSKIFEGVIAERFYSADECDKYQFGFKAKHSTAMCTSVFKQTVDYYRNRGSHVFACFVDYVKAFDYVNHWKLFLKLLQDDVDVNLVSMMAYWYANQQLCVRWISTFSQFFTTTNGTRQGGILSPYLFSRYVRDLLDEVVQSRCGCCIGDVMLNVLAYADDLVLLAPSWRAMQDLLHLLDRLSKSIDMTCSTKKTVCMVFQPKMHSKIVAKSFPPLKLGNESLQYVSSFKYLGHVISSTLTDDSDIQREICNMFMRTNKLVRRFSKCSLDVKVKLFRSYCICLYDAALWSTYNIGTINKLAACYNRCIKTFFGFTRRDSVTQILFRLGLPSFNTVLHNCKAIFIRTWLNSYNGIISHVRQIFV